MPLISAWARTGSTPSGSARMPASSCGVPRKAPRRVRRNRGRRAVLPAHGEGRQLRLDVRQAGPAQFGFAVDHQGAGGDVAQALKAGWFRATEQTEGVAEGQDVGEAQQVAQQRRGPAHRSAVVVDDAQSHHLLPDERPLVEHLEEDHVPPGRAMKVSSRPRPAPSLPRNARPSIAPA